MSDTTHISETVSTGQLRAFIERIERVEEEIKTLNADKSDIYKELRGVGFDVKAVRQCVAARKLDSAEREERNAIFDLYWEALTGASRVHVHEGRGVDPTSTPPHDPETGELTDTQEQPETSPAIQTPANAPRLAADDEAAQAQTSSAPISLTRIPPVVDDGQPDPSANATPAQKASSRSDVGQAASTGGHSSGEFAQQSVSAAQARNEPGSASGASVTLSEAEIPQFLKADHEATVDPEPAHDNFINPRCKRPKTCPRVHSHIACYDCTMAWSKLPKAEQVLRWQDAVAASETEAA